MPVHILVGCFHNSPMSYGFVAICAKQFHGTFCYAISSCIVATIHEEQERRHPRALYGMQLYFCHLGSMSLIYMVLLNISVVALNDLLRVE